MASKNAPWILKHGYAVLADLHLGVELDQAYLGFRAPVMLERYLELLENIPASKLIILGDVKHQIFTNTKIIRNFLEELSSRFSEVIITKGNHDGKLEELASNLENVHVVRYFKLGPALFAHGHTRLPEDVLQEANELYMGHVHPAISLSYELPWFSGKEMVKVFLRYQDPDEKQPKIIVLPTANPLLVGINILEFDFDVPLIKQLSINPEEFEVILIDRTNLGKIKHLKKQFSTSQIK
jgi:putative SbcD/Mre11-related phosphoesterase